MPPATTAAVDPLLLLRVSELLLERESPPWRATHCRRLLSAAPVTVLPLSKARVYLASNRRSLRVQVAVKGTVGTRLLVAATMLR